MNLDQIMPTFIVESRELLEVFETKLLAVEGAIDDETVNAIFRAVHTIKGSAGLFQLDPIVAFAHVLESVLDTVRDGKLAVDPELIALLLKCGDHIFALVGAIEAGRLEPDEELKQTGAPLLQQLRAYLSPAAAPTAEATAADVRASLPPNAAGEGPVVEAHHWHISLRFGPEVMRNGMDPLSFIRYLGQLGSIVGIVTLPDAIPTADEYDPEACYLGFEIAFDSKADKATIEGVFDFVREDSRIRILPPHSRASEYILLIQALPEESSRLGEILVRCGSLTSYELDEALASQQALPVPAPQLGTLLIEQGRVSPAVVDAALAKQARVKELKAQEVRSIRIDADKLDQLINLVGELIIAAASTDLVARRSRATELQERTATLTGLVQAVRDNALQLRMVRIGATFNRFQRVVHDVSRELGKDIELVVSGEETELDKTVVERIADPLTHLVRNALDHGIEPADMRRASGKAARGTVRLNAYHDSGQIVIEVSDDGGGLKRDKILAKGIERGLVEPGRVLSDRDIYGLIFEPGFSTADKITNLSGRGVGMDVVKGNITALRGTVNVDSQTGVGTTVTVRLPLTLAIINGFLVGVGKSVFVVPLEMIEECVEFSTSTGHDYIDLRGQVLPFIRLREFFAIQSGVGSRENIVVVNHAGRKTGLVVDKLLGEFQTVIKPLGKIFHQVRGISGSSILGTGDVALILDVPALIQQAS